MSSTGDREGINMRFFAVAATFVSRFFLFSFLSSFTLLWAESEASHTLHLKRLHLKPGEHYQVPQHIRLLTVDSLILEARTSIEIPSEQNHFQFNAAKARVKEGVRIFSALGVASHQAQSVKASLSPNAVDCRKPTAGAGGVGGANGQDGIDIALNWHVIEFGALLLDVNGVNGVQGEAGLPGQNADQNAKCKLVDGGAGGRGGKGGDGGAGGDVSLAYSGPEGEKAQGATRVRNSGGEAGQGGQGGVGGIGSASRFSKRKTLTGMKRVELTGAQGKTGPEGTVGQSGTRGRVQFVHTETNVIMSIPTGGHQSGALLERLNALEKRVLELEKRISQ